MMTEGCREGQEGRSWETVVLNRRRWLTERRKEAQCQGWKSLEPADTLREDLVTRIKFSVHRVVHEVDPLNASQPSAGRLLGPWLWGLGQAVLPHGSFSLSVKWTF